MTLTELRDQTCHKLVPDVTEGLTREQIVRLLEKAYKFGWRDAMNRQAGTGLAAKCTKYNYIKKYDEDKS